MPTKKADKTVQVVDPQATSPAPATPKPPKTPPSVGKKRTGPKPLVLQDLSGILDKVEAMSPEARQAHRTRLAEGLVDAWILRATERLLSDKVRSQDLVAVAGFLRANEFIVTPSKAHVEDPLSKMVRLKKEADAEEALRLKRMAAAKEKENQRVERFYAKVNGEPLSPRLNQGDPGNLGIDNEGDLNDE